MKRVLFLSIVCLILTAALFASGGSDKESADGKPTVTMMLSLNAEFEMEGNPVIAQIEEKTGVNLDITAPSQNDYFDRLAVAVASGDMPDLIHNGTDIKFTQWANEGLLYDLTEVRKSYPNIMAQLSTGQWGDGSIDGKVYAIPRPNSYDFWGFVINKKWLDKLGLKVPTTVAEFEAVCTAFTKNDPDGNGKNDTFGATFSTKYENEGAWSLYNDFLTSAYSLSTHPGMPDFDGSFPLTPFKSRYWDYVNQMAKMYKAGIIDREWVTHKTSEGTEAVEKVAQGRVGIVGFTGKRYMTEFIEKYKLNPNDFVYAAPLVLKKGDTPSYMMPPSAWMSYQVNADVDDKQLHNILKVVDYMMSEEGFVLTQLGIKGRDYNSYDIELRSVDQTPAQATQSMKDASPFFAFANAYDGRALIEGGTTAANSVKWRAETGAADKITQKIYTPAVKVLSSMNAELPDEARELVRLEVQAYTGQDNGELKNFLDTVYKPATAKFAKELETFCTANPVEIVK